jgi:nucleotide sugar dehydrogenase
MGFSMESGGVMNKHMNISVVGGGRMGLPLACAFARNGAYVTVCDLNPEIVRAVDAGLSPYEEPGLAALIAQLHRAGTLGATTRTAEAVAESDATVVIVPAHLTADRDIDLRHLLAASADVGRGLRRNALVCYETTVAVGTTRTQLVPALERYSNLVVGRDFHVGYSPERVKSNLVLSRLENTPKVVGGLNAESLERAAALYRQYLGAPVDEVGSLEAAEMSKLVGMLYRDVNIALANELAAFCERLGIDFARVRAAANNDGESNLLQPGIGVGGHCTPVYPYFVTRESRRIGLPQRLSETARDVNDLQPGRQLQRLERSWRPLRGSQVHLLGLGFRPDVKVDTFSPAYALRDELEKLGADVTMEDPLYSADELAACGFKAGKAEQAAVVVLNTAHTTFGNPDFVAWRRAGVEVVLDGRNCWNQSAVEAAGLLYFGIGRASQAERGKLGES